MEGAPNLGKSFDVVGLETLRRAAGGEEFDKSKVIRRRLISYSGAIPLAGVDIFEISTPPIESYRVMRNDLLVNAELANWPKIAGDVKKIKAKKVWRYEEASALRVWFEKQKEQNTKGTVLVTGGAGYIGSHTVRKLLKEGYDVVILDSLVKGRQFLVDRNKLFAEKSGRNLVFEKGDLGDREFVKGVFSRNNISSVIHFAAFIEVGESVAKPAIYFKNNIINTMYLLDAMKDANVGKIVFSSSAAVYGNPKEVPIPENSETNPINSYGYTKLMMEKMIRYYQEKFGIKWVAFRYFNASGDSSDGDLGEAHFPESHLIPAAIDMIFQGKEMKAFGTDYDTRDGTCLRDYISVEDLASAHVLALEAKDDALNRAYNLGTGSGLTVKEIIENVGRLLGMPAKWIDAGRRPGDPDSLTAVSTAFQNATGWRLLASSIDTIIGSAIKWFKDRPEEAKEPKPLPDLDEGVLAMEIERSLSENNVIPEELKTEILNTLNLNRRYAVAAAKLKEYGQEDLLADWNNLSPEEKHELLDDVETGYRKDMAIKRSQLSERHESIALQASTETSSAGLKQGAEDEDGGTGLVPSEVVQTSKATQLFELVESSLSNERAKFIEEGKRLAPNIESGMATVEIRQRIEKAIEIASVAEFTLSEANVEFLRKNLAQFEADGAVGSLIVLARKAKRENQKLIIGLETDWMPGMQVKSSLQKNAMSALMREIDSIGEALKSMGLDNVEIVHESAGQLADSLTKVANDSNTSMHNIVVMASKNTINSNSFKGFREASAKDKPFLTGIDPIELIKLYEQYGESVSYQLHIKLTTLLYMALEIASGKEPPKASWIQYDSVMRILMLTPSAEIKDYQALKDAIKAEITALQNA